MPSRKGHTHPYTSGLSGRVCLGDTYPEEGVFLAPKNCGRSGYNTTVDSTFNNAIKPYLSNSLPTPSTSIFGDGTQPWSARGAYFDTNNALVVDGVPNPWVIMYTLEGINRCPVGPIMGTGTWPNLNSTPPSHGYTITLNGGTRGVECWIVMPDPKKM